MSRPTVVLGWDGLDYELCHEFGLADHFVPSHCRIDTFDNEVLGRPQTYEVWPSILTGVDPKVHGIRIVGDGIGATTSNPLACAVNGVFHTLVPLKARVRIGLALQNRGIGFDQKTPDWYRNRGLRTVFDDLDSRPIGVPNYKTEEDGGLERQLEWSRRRARYVEIEPRWEERTVVYEPKEDLGRIERWLEGDARTRLDLAEDAVRRGHDLVFVWVPYLDAVGHLTPVVADGFQRRAYEFAAEATHGLREALDVRFVVVSDHGHRAGVHTHDAVFGSTDPTIAERVESVFDVRDALAA